jgi:hypothetical protein
MRRWSKLMLSGLGPAALLALAGCEKSFDERYADAEKKLNDQAASIDQELAVRASEASLMNAGEPSAAPSSTAP